MEDFTGYQSFEITHGFMLCMNSIFANAESVGPVAVAATYEDMAAWVDDQRERWEDNIGDRTYRKNFRAGSPLENYNPPYSMDPDRHGVFGDGVYEVDMNVKRLTPDIYVIPAGYAQMKEAVDQDGREETN